MSGLALDVARCEPVHANSHCRICLRWAQRPGQTFGERTPVTSVDSSQDEGCRFIREPDLWDVWHQKAMGASVCEAAKP